MNNPIAEKSPSTSVTPYEELITVYVGVGLSVPVLFKNTNSSR
jgi:hypothetical protein